jgi:hypothetical protein
MCPSHHLVWAESSASVRKLLNAEEEDAPDFRQHQATWVRSNTNLRLWNPEEQLRQRCTQSVSHVTDPAASSAAAQIHQQLKTWRTPKILDYRYQLPSKMTNQITNMATWFLNVFSNLRAPSVSSHVRYAGSTWLGNTPRWIDPRVEEEFHQSDSRLMFLHLKECSRTAQQRILQFVREQTSSLAVLKNFKKW